MGWLCPSLLLPVSCLVLVWVAGSGSLKVLEEPTCFSDYMSTSTCEWRLDGPVNCSAQLHLFYRLDFEISENHTCVPENSAHATCVCNMLTDNLVRVDTYQLDLWAGRQQLWHGFFTPSYHVKPRAPENLTVHAAAHDTRLLTWCNPYPPENHLYRKLTYLVNISTEDDPAEFRIYNVTYTEPALRLAASTLRFGVTYKAQVRAWAQSYNGTWSKWSHSVEWQNYYNVPLEQRLPLAVIISCIIIPAVCLSCYFSVTKIKKEWWDQIPSPARSPLMAIVIQDAQVSLWERRARVQEPSKCPHWKTCLAKLLPCLLEHDINREEDSTKATGSGLFQGSEKPAWRPVEVSSTVLRPESISVVRCVELFEAPAESEEEAEEEDKANFCTSPESSRGFQEGREGIMARLTESLFLDLLGGGLPQPGVGVSCPPPPSESGSARTPWAPLPGVGSVGAASQGAEQRLLQEPSPPASATQGPAGLAQSEMPVVIADNPAYRCFSSLQSRAPSPGALDPDPQLAERPAPEGPCAPQPAEPPSAFPLQPESWEQILHRSVLQHGATTAPTLFPASGYREFLPASEQGSTQNGQVVGSGPCGDAGYKAFSSLLTNSAICSGTSGLGAGSGDGSYKPFQNLLPGFPGDPAPLSMPLFTFGLDMEPPGSTHNSLPTSTPLEHLGLQPVVKGEDRQKPLHPLEQATDPLRDDLGSGIVYSALTCHLCGHLKQCHGQEEGGQAQVVASPCCGCHCGDRSSPPGSPLGALHPAPGGPALEANLPPASLVPLGSSDQGKSSLSFQPPHPTPSSAQTSSQPPKPVGLVSMGPPYTRVS